MSLLSTHDLAIGYPGKPALQKDLNLAVNQGQIISLMGQNGVGKTTFLKTINGLLPVISGEVRMNGQSLEKLSRLEIAKDCALVLTEKPANHQLSVIDLVAMGRHPYSNWLGLLSQEDKTAVESAIHQTKIDYIAERKIGELSDGQLQKVMIARALAQDTNLIILDEPVAHLDLNNKIEVMRLLREIAKQGKGILISTHDIQVTTQLSDELWLFGFGTQVQTGIPEDLILNGQLEKTLYLEHHHYDFVHHRLLNVASGPAIQLTGDEDVAYWTEQALVRAGYQVGASEIVVECQSTSWSLQNEDYSTIAGLIEGVRGVRNAEI
ncbi:MAG: ABC transporter ATP-binding protein [Cytophagales bacterium]|nr:ABC transporter ATP-binding protein [Cytophagales bacterium]